MSAPDQFLADKDTDVVAVVLAKRVKTRWIVLKEDGDKAPLNITDCEMTEPLRLEADWPKGTTRAVAQIDYSDLVFEAIAPPAVEGARYLLWATPPPPDWATKLGASWTAHPQGLLLIRGSGDREFVYWNGKSYGVPAIRKAIAESGPIPLDQIVDPALRLRIARERMRKGALGEERAFVSGLLVNVTDPDGQATQVESSRSAEKGADTFGMAEGGKSAHALWYESLTLLRDLGRDETHRESVVTALEPLATTTRERIRLVVALALVDLGSDAGREALVAGYQYDTGAISSDPPDKMTFPGRYPHDQSSITASAYALARLGDSRGLGNDDPEVRLVTAEGLAGSGDFSWKVAVRQIATESDREVAKLQQTGKLKEPRRPGDYTNRYPDRWIRSHALLARFADDGSLRKLFEAYLADAETHPRSEAALYPRGIPSTWTSGPSLAGAFRSLDSKPEPVLARLEKLYGADERWNGEAARALRMSLGDPTLPQVREEERRASDQPEEPEISRRLAADDPRKRAEALAAAGYHDIDALYEKVVDTALHGSGVEQSAAVYALGFYSREVPEPVLRELLADKDPAVQLTAFELATRVDPARFGEEALVITRALLAVVRGTERRAEDRRALIAKYLVRILSRFSRAELPATFLEGLKDADPHVRAVFVRALGMGGNPDAIRHIEPLASDSDDEVRGSVEIARSALGPQSP